MFVAILLNIVWILWVLYTFYTGFGVYSGIHSHAYVYFFFSGLFAILIGSLWLKVHHFRNRSTPWVRVGFALWLIGSLMFILCIFAGVRLPSAHILKEHVIFNHVNFLIFMLGMIISVYTDTKIVARLDSKKIPQKSEGIATE